MREGRGLHGVRDDALLHSRGKPRRERRKRKSTPRGRRTPSSRRVSSAWLLKEKTGSSLPAASSERKKRLKNRGTTISVAYFFTACPAGVNGRKKKKKASLVHAPMPLAHKRKRSLRRPTSKSSTLLQGEKKRRKRNNFKSYPYPRPMKERETIVRMTTEYRAAERGGEEKGRAAQQYRIEFSSEGGTGAWCATV